MRLPGHATSIIDLSSVVVAAATNDGRPFATLGWGPRVNDAGDRLTVFVEERRATDVLRSIRENGRIAVTYGDPISYRSVQVKGRDCAVVPMAYGDEEAITQHRNTVASNFALTGDPLTGLRNMWMNDFIRLEFTIAEAYDQTPGPNAGRPL